MRRKKKHDSGEDERRESLSSCSLSPVPCRRSSFSGFTLMELIVATMIFSVVIGASFSLFKSGQDVVRRSEYRAELDQTARDVLRKIEADLAGMWPSDSDYDLGLTGTDDTIDDIPCDTVELLAVNRHPAFQDEETKAADLSRVLYYIDPDEGLMCRRTTALLRTVIGTEEEDEGESVSPSVVGLDFQYYAEDGSWSDTWDSEQRDGELPLALEVAVVVRGVLGRTEEWEWFTIRFPFRLRDRQDPAAEEEEAPK